MNDSVKETVVIVTYFCCGKSTLAGMKSPYSILDFDSFLIDQNKDTFTDSDKNRVAKYGSLPVDDHYLTTLLSSIGKYDVILLSSKLQILEFLKKKKVPYVLVYPENTKACIEEWERRNKERGTEWLWEENKDSFSSVIKCFLHDNNAIAHIALKSNEYLSMKLEEIIEVAKEYRSTVVENRRSVKDKNDRYKNRGCFQNNKEIQ